MHITKMNIKLQQHLDTYLSIGVLLYKVVLHNKMAVQ